MQNSIFNSIRSLKFIDGCKGGSQLCAVNPSAVGSSTEKPRQHQHYHNHHHRRQGSGHHFHQVDPTHTLPSSSTSFQHRLPCQTPISPDSLLPYGLPSPDLIDPAIDPFLRPVEPVLDLSSAYCCLSSSRDLDRCSLHLKQRSLLRFVDDPKLLRRSLRSARLHAPDLHHRVVLSAWLRYERREDELKHPTSSSSSAPATCGGPSIECPRAALLPGGYNPEIALAPCPCRRSSPPDAQLVAEEDETEADEEEEGEEGADIMFCIDDEEVPCLRERIAALSRPFCAMMYGGFAELRRERIAFSHNGVSAIGMRAIESYSRKGSLEGGLDPDVALEVLAFANLYCCEGLRSACDAWLASLVHGMDDALLLLDHGLDESAHLLVASCLQVFLRELPRSLRHPQVARLFCGGDGRARLASAGHGSFALYHFLTEVAMEEDMRSNSTVMLLERLCEVASPGWERQLALHQLGCVMLAREEYEDAQWWFEGAVEAGHPYSLAGVARAKYRRGNRYTAFKLVNSLVCEHGHTGWMYQERSLYCITKEEKMRDLDEATGLDPTLYYPYKYRAVMMMEDGKLGAAVAEVGKVLGFKVSTDCLELRAWLSMALEDYEGALRDIRALMTLDPGYMMFHGKVHGEQLVEVLQNHVQQWSLADCWLQLHDRWSSVDDIGSLAVVHQMLANDPCKSVLRFRQSLLLLRLNCQKAAMRSLRLARNHSLYEHERRIYEGWILYDTGHREEALAKAEESISIQRSFEAFFLKAYALADTSLDVNSANYVIELLQEALKCPSDGLRKGQALNNLGSIYVDCDKLDQATDCYVNALNIRHTRAHQGLARVYHLKNQRKAAYDEMTKLIEKARNNASAYEKRSEYCDRDMAKSDLYRATQLDPLRTYPYRYRAAVLMDDHKQDEAIAELTKALAFKPDLQLLHLRAAFYDSMGDTEATLKDCEAALCLDPNHNDTLDLYRKACERSDIESK